MNTELAHKAKWPPQLVLDIALEAYTQEDLLDKYQMSEYELRLLYENVQFRRELITTRTELQTSGSKFRSGAKALSEVYLSNMDELMNDPTVAPQTKVTIWQSMVRYAELEPRKESANPQSSGNTFNIQINM